VTPDRTRKIRQILLGLMAFVVVCIVLTFRRPPGRPERDAAPGASRAKADRDVTRERIMTGYEVKRIREGREIVLRAEKMVGREDEEIRLQGVNLRFTYVSQGKPQTAEITSDECLYAPRSEQAKFRGHVRITSAEGVGLETERLDYEGASEVAHTDAPFSFTRGTVSGRGKGFRYDAGSGVLVITAAVELVVSEEGKPPMQIRSDRAYMKQRDGVVRFIGNVDVVQADNDLRCGELILNLSGDNAVQHAGALQGVTAHLRGGYAVLSGKGQTATRGMREIEGRKLDLYFRPDRSLREMI
jgi:LPS export ABC transporter protein LptC